MQLQARKSGKELTDNADENLKLLFENVIIPVTAKTTSTPGGVNQKLKLKFSLSVILFINSMFSMIFKKTNE